MLEIHLLPYQSRYLGENGVSCYKYFGTAMVWGVSMFCSEFFVHFNQNPPFIFFSPSNDSPKNR